RSLRSGRHYYGHTSDLLERLERHNSDRSASTKGRGPWKLISYTECATKGEAMSFELKLKMCKDPGRALRLISERNSIM
nr:GIY-YIG nuclease family protein [Flavobacteriales bacterium]